jgi:2-oxoglutarate dehydrogenase complex dehydrogenase (E1) component-like enzyme
VHPKLRRQLDKRGDTAHGGEVDWATAEALALGSLVTAGTPVRLTGQDTERGTFSQRHLVLHDAVTGATYCPIQHLGGAAATFELHNSPLSELAALGFEYGYSAAAPEALVIWEAQFGDFVNGAQIVVDQFISSGDAKWGIRSRLVLLLPHGYEGQGPEHSSARLERFLQLSANGNIRVASPSTAAQHFHLLRMQALAPQPRPLVVMTPKSLLRSRSAASPLAELATGRYRAVLDDPAVDAAMRERVRTLLLCSGKIYHDLVASPLRAAATGTAIARVEMLDPLPLEEIIATVRSYPRLEQLLWVQEEPRNMGAWGHIQRPIGRLRPYKIRWDYIGRPRRASPSEGFHGAHEVEQERIIRDALTAEQISSEEALALARSGATL